MLTFSLISCLAVFLTKLFVSRPMFEMYNANVTLQEFIDTERQPDNSCTLIILLSIIDGLFTSVTKGNYRPIGLLYGRRSY